MISICSSGPYDMNQNIWNQMRTKTNKNVLQTNLWLMLSWKCCCGQFAKYQVVSIHQCWSFIFTFPCFVYFLIGDFRRKHGKDVRPQARSRSVSVVSHHIFEGIMPYVGQVWWVCDQCQRTTFTVQIPFKHLLEMNYLKICINNSI